MFLAKIRTLSFFHLKLIIFKALKSLHIAYVCLRNVKKDEDPQKKRRHNLKVFGLLPLKNKLLINEFLLLISNVSESIKSDRKSVILKFIR